MDTELAEQIRRACYDAAKRAFDEAGVRGLCPEGCVEFALDAIRSCSLDEILHRDDTKNEES